MATDRKDSNIVHLDGSVEAFKKANGMTEIVKEKPVSLAKRKGKNYPIDALGKDLSSIVKEIHRVVQAPIGICAQSVLATISYASQMLANVHVDSQVIPLSLYFFTVAQSGERKSAVDNVATRPIADYERKLQEQFEISMREYESAMQCREIKSMISKPRDPIILMAEPTFEGLVKAFETGQASLALFSDEGGHFLSGHAMSADNKIKTVAGLSSIWDGAPITRVRQGQPNIKLYDKRLAFHLMMQPGIALNTFADKAIVDQGFIPRCLITWPDSTMGNRPYISENIYQSPIYKEYENKLNSLLDNYLRPILSQLHLSPAAYNAYIAFYYEVEHSLREDGDLTDISGFANKMLNQACRLAAVMTIYSYPSAIEIDETTFKNACELMRFYQSENIRLIGESTINLITMGNDEKLIQADALWRWLSNPEIKEKHFSDGLIKLRIIRQSAARKFRDKQTVLELMKILTEYEYVSAISGTDNMWEYLA